MCINPTSHEGKTFACRKCWQCKENRIQDWVGRCIAENKTSTRALYGTLTYGRVEDSPDHARATVLTYSDVQKYFKRLRSQGHEFSYLVAGEFGGLKGRTHWHVLLFFRGRSPDYALRTKKYSHESWPHGFSFWDEFNPSNAKYVCKYMRKDEDDSESQSIWRMSKEPPIGARYFDQLAQQYVDMGAAPQDLSYKHPENRGKDRKPVKHMMQGTTAKRFVHEFVRRWGYQRTEQDLPNSDIVDAYIDSMNADTPGAVMAPRRYRPKVFYKPTRDSRVTQSDTHNTYQCDVGGTVYRWCALNQDEPAGEHAWRSAAGHVIRFHESQEQRDKAYAASAKAQADLDRNLQASRRSHAIDCAQRLQHEARPHRPSMRGDLGPELLKLRGKLQSRREGHPPRSTSQRSE